MGVTVGGTGVRVAVGEGDGVGVQLGVKVKVGRGVFVGWGVRVGTRTSSVPTEQPKPPSKATTSSRPGKNLHFVIKAESFLLQQRMAVIFNPHPNPSPQSGRGAGARVNQRPAPVHTSQGRAGAIVDGFGRDVCRTLLQIGESYFFTNQAKSQYLWLGSVLYGIVTTGETRAPDLSAT